MFPIDAPEDGMLKDDAGDVGGGKPWKPLEKGSAG